jgi:hypothetical protein
MMENMDIASIYTEIAEQFRQWGKIGQNIADLFTKLQVAEKLRAGVSFVPSPLPNLPDISSIPHFPTSKPSVVDKMKADLESLNKLPICNSQSRCRPDEQPRF